MMNKQKNNEILSQKREKLQIKKRILDFTNNLLDILVPFF